MNKYQLDEKVIFVWNFREFPGIIRGITKSGNLNGVNYTVYKVEFSPHIEAGSYNTMRDIHEAFLKSTESLKIEEKIKRILIKI
jgi:hypothetical protein